MRTLALAVLLLLAPLARGADHERWYIIEMDGRRAGWMHQLQATEADRIVSTAEMHFELRRGELAVLMAMQTEFVETLDHKPVSMRLVRHLGQVPSTTDYTFADDHIAIATEEAGRRTTSRAPLPLGEWLTPAAAGELVARRLAEDAEEIVIRAIDPMAGPAPVTTTYRDFHGAEVEVSGEMVAALRCSATVSLAPVKSVHYLDRGGLALRSTTSLGAIEMTMIAADRAAALGEIDAPEMMVSTFVTPDRPIAAPRRAAECIVILSIPDGDLPEIPETGAQSVERINGGAARITIRAGSGADRTPADAADAENGSYLESSSMVNADDPAVRRLASRAAGDAAEPSRRAEAMRRFVFRHVNKKSLGVGFASASEVARTREGDCTEHAVLLAAMLRADGIPARIVSGLVYADEFAGARGIFGYHMWTQALLDTGDGPAWVDLDAALSAGSPFDATHIALAVAALSDGEPMTSLMSVAPLLGRIAIRVESAGATVPVRSP